MTRQPQNSPNPEGSSQDRGVLDEALEPAQIRSLNSALRKLTETDGVSKDMQEAAKRMLSGRLALRDALDDPQWRAPSAAAWRPCAVSGSRSRRRNATRSDTERR